MVSFFTTKEILKLKQVPIRVSEWSRFVSFASCSHIHPRMNLALGSGVICLLVGGSDLVVSLSVAVYIKFWRHCSFISSSEISIIGGLSGKDESG